jgi:hypothetical protein
MTQLHYFSLLPMPSMVNRLLRESLRSLCLCVRFFFDLSNLAQVNSL